MGSNEKVIKNLNYCFWIIIIIVIIIKIFSIFEPLLVSKFGNNETITDENILNELADCTANYINVIKNKQYVKANTFNYFLNEKTNEQYEKIYKQIVLTPNYKVIIKEIYKLSDETYRCYYLIKDKADNNIQNLDKVDKNLMNSIVIRLDTKNYTFKVLDDLFVIGGK